ncbi:MAG: AAA family ATPase [Wenzhouxiangellaceae bacterium]|nr:AAA family ATPase [Wenzhouxiangellaceae bacterium]
MALTRIPPAELRWRLSPEALADDDNLAAIGSESLARLGEALTLTAYSKPSHCGGVFIRGAPGTGRRSLLKQAVAGVQPPPQPLRDCCFVHNFDSPDRPRLIQLPPGQGRQFRLEIQEISCFIRDQLEVALQSRPIRNRLQALNDRSDAEMRRITAPLEARLKPHGLILVREEVGQLVRLTVHVQQTGRVITQDDLANLVAKGQVSQKEFNQIREIIRESQQQLSEISKEVNQIWKRSQQLGNRLLRAETRRLLANLAQPLIEQFDQAEVNRHIDSMIGDVLEKRVGRPTAHLADPELLYGVNLVFAAAQDAGSLYVENHPTPRNLIGTIDPSWLESNRSIASFRGIRAGSLLAASGGFLVLDAETLLDQGESITLLRQTLASEQISITTAAEGGASIALRPDPIPLRARLVLIGTDAHWRELHRRHPGLMRLFDAPVDIPETIPRDLHGARRIAQQLKQECARLELPRPSREALAALVEHAARAGGVGRLSTRISELVGLAQRAALLDKEQAQHGISAAGVAAAIKQARFSAPARHTLNTAAASSFPARRPLQGQLHMSCIEHDGRLQHGRLVRVQTVVTTGQSSAFAFDGIAGASAEIRANLGLQIEVLLARVLHIDEPLRIHAVFRCSDAGGQAARIEASESLLFCAMAALLSELAEQPLRQNLAVSADLGLDTSLLAVPFVNERIEAVFQFAHEHRSEIDAGIIIPAVQRNALMLEPEVIQASTNDLFHIHTSGNLAQALELLGESSPGVWKNDRFSTGSLFQKARARLTGA